MTMLRQLGQANNQVRKRFYIFLFSLLLFVAIHLGYFILCLKPYQYNCGICIFRHWCSYLHTQNTSIGNQEVNHCLPSHQRHGMESVGNTGLKLYSTGKISNRKWSVSSSKLKAKTVKYIICGNVFLSKACLFVSTTNKEMAKTIYYNNRGYTLNRYPLWIGVYACILTHYPVRIPYHLKYIWIWSLWAFLWQWGHLISLCDFRQIFARKMQLIFFIDLLI